MGRCYSVEMDKQKIPRRRHVLHSTSQARLKFHPLDNTLVAYFTYVSLLPQGISPRLNSVPNERSIASLPDTRVSIQFVPFTLARTSSGALSLNGAVGLAHSPGQNLRGQSAPTKAEGPIYRSSEPPSRLVPVLCQF
jgi:hypothetical protein